MSTMTVDNFSKDSSLSEVKDFITLLKPGVLLLVVYTAFVGALIAPGHVHPFLAALSIFSIALGSGAAGAFNMWYDRDIDGLMARTRLRPIPSGRIAPSDALGFAAVLSVTSVVLMYFASNLQAALLLVFSIFFYDVIYTMLLKRTTAQNIVIGGAAGAFPPVIGWLSIVPEYSWEPLVLFAIIFLWTPSHFWALALNRCQDYARVNVPMLPVTAGPEKTRRAIFVYSALLIAASFLPYFLNYKGMIYLVTACVLGAVYMYLAWRVLRYQNPKDAMKLFSYSIAYLFLLFSGMLLDHYLVK